MALVEYKKGEIAHVSNRYKVAGVLNPDAETDNDLGVKRFMLQSNEAITITKAHKATDDYAIKHNGGAIYDATVERDGKLYYIEDIPQRVLCSKAGWAKTVELEAKIAALTASQGGSAE